MDRIYLNVEQSVMLFDRMNREFPESVKCAYNRNLETDVVEVMDSKTSYAFTHEFIAPVFTLADLLDFIGTDFIIDGDECFVNYMPHIENGERYYGIYWFSKSESECVKMFIGETLLEAAFECYMWMFDELDKIDSESEEIKLEEI